MSHAIGVTRLQSFLTRYGIRPMYFADHAGVSRQYLLKLRKGEAEPTRPMMIRLTHAARSITGQRVMVRELFDLGDS